MSTLCPKRLIHQMSPKNENFWGCLAQKVCVRGWKAKIEQQLIRRIECMMKDFDTNFVQSLIEGIKAKSQIYM